MDDVSLDIARGELLAVTGPSGCGKSTLLHLLGGLDRPAAGELWLAGERIDRYSERALAHLRRGRVGFVFQAFHLMDEHRSWYPGRDPQEPYQRGAALIAVAATAAPRRDA